MENIEAVRTNCRIHQLLSITNCRGMEEMRLTTTDGKEIITPDTCGYCRMDTAGQHDPKCPCYVNSHVTYEINGHLFVEFQYHPLYNKKFISIKRIINYEYEFTNRIQR